MRKVERKVTIAGGVLALAVVLAYLLGVLSGGGVAMAFVLIGISGLVYYFSKKTGVERTQDYADREVTDGPFKGLMREPEARKHLLEWADESYGDDDKMGLDWSEAAFQTYFNRKSGLFVYGYYTGFGKNNRGVVAWVSGNDGRVLGHARATYDEYEEDPFKGCILVQEDRNRTYYNSAAAVAAAQSNRGKRTPRGMPWDEEAAAAGTDSGDEED